MPKDSDVAVRFFGGDLEYSRATDGSALVQAKCKVLASYASQKKGGLTFQWAAHRALHRLPRGCASVPAPYFPQEPYAFLNEAWLAVPNEASLAAILAKCAVEYSFVFLEQVRFRISWDQDGALVPLHASGSGIAGRVEALVLGVSRLCRMNGEPADGSFYLARPVAFSRLEEKRACTACGLPELLPEDVAQALARKAFNHLRKCAGCSSARYCSTACQKADWSVHKAFCLARQHCQKLKQDEALRMHRPLHLAMHTGPSRMTRVVGAGSGAGASHGFFAGFDDYD